MYTHFPLSVVFSLTFLPPPPPLQDYGYPQSTSTEQLKMYVHNEPVAVEASKAGAGGGMMSGNRKTISSSAVQKPISISNSSTGKKNEIFVDILERLTVLFNANVSSSSNGGLRRRGWRIIGCPLLYNLRSSSSSSSCCLCRATC